MVEFGLKLEDNKVAEWRDKYVRYDRLKLVLDRAKKNSERFKALKAKNPSLAASIEEAYYRKKVEDEAEADEGNKAATSSPTNQSEGGDAAQSAVQSTTASFLSERLGLLPSIQEASNSTAAAGAPADETTGLRSGASSRASSPYSSLRPGASDDDSSAAPSKRLKRVDSSHTLIQYLERAATGVNDFFEKQYVKQIRDALKTLDACADEFDALLREDVNMVNSFYADKLNDTKGRLQLLKESVAVSFFNLPPPPPPPAEEDGQPQQPGSDHSLYLETPLIEPQHRKHHDGSSFVAAVKKSLLTLQLHHQQQQQRHRKQKSSSDSFPTVGESQSLLPLADDDDEEEVEAGMMHVDDSTTEHGGGGSAGSASAAKAASKDAVQKAREAESVQRSLIDLYRRAKLLHNYAIMNYTGFVKIVKKHDKTLSRRKGAFKKMIADVCHEGGKDVEKLGETIEKLYANWFCGRSVTEARAQLLPKQGDGLEMDWSQLRLGYRMGMCSILALWVAWDCIWGTISKGTSTIGGRTAFPVFRACGGLLLLQWFWGCSLWVWTRYRVNYIYLFDLNPHTVSTPLGIFNEAVDHSLVFLIGMLLYYKAGANDLPIDFPAGIVPFLMVLYTLVQLILPWRTRRSMWHAIRLVVTTPMTSPTFFHGYIGDIFTSMVKVFQDIAWTIGFIVSGDFMIREELAASTKHKWAKSVWYSKILIPLLTLLPLWFRFNQCLRRYTDTRNRMPHLANAGKYALSMTVTLFGAFHPLYLQTTAAQPSDWFQIFWMCTFVSSSLYSFFWDVRMDWGLGRIDYQLLGPRLMYPSKASYYVVIGIDLVLRFAWVLTLVPPNSGAKFALPQYLTAVSMMMELFRRTLWGFFRLENEHRSNTSGYRRVDFVPLHFSTQHDHAYKGENPHRGGHVLVEVAVVTLLVLGAAVASVVAAQHETERLMGPSGEL